MSLSAKRASTIALFAALISICSATAHSIAWVGHPIIGAIIVTFLYLTAFSVTGKLGTTTVIGLLVGIINSFIFGSPLSIPIHLVRGAIFDFFFAITRHRLCCRKCAIASSMLSFYATMIVIFALYTLVGLPFVSWTIWFVVAGVPSVLLTIPGALLALKYKQTFQRVVVGA